MNVRTIEFVKRSVYELTIFADCARLRSIEGGPEADADRTRSFDLSERAKGMQKALDILTNEGLDQEERLEWLQFSIDSVSGLADIVRGQLQAMDVAPDDARHLSQQLVRLDAKAYGMKTAKNILFG